MTKTDLRVVAATTIAALLSVRIYELWLDASHTRRLRQLGATYHGTAGLGAIVVGQVLFLAGAAAESVVIGRGHEAELSTAGFLGIGLGAMLVRHWCIQTLGVRWTIRVYTLPSPLVRAGPYRFLRHPNYLAVFVELVAVCAALQAWITLAAAGATTAGALLYRIQQEERILSPLRGAHTETVPR